MTAIPTSLCELFAQAVERYPENLAVDHKEGSLTYHELNEASSALANDLVSLGIGNGSPVLLLTAHGSFNLVAILAILKCGGCFVPVDRRTWSSDMINHVCNIVDGSVIINTTAEPFSPLDTFRHVLHLTSLPQARPETNYSSSLCHIEPEDAACIIFTSGSTGQPKGVMISHRSLCLYSKTSPINLDIAPGDRLLHMLSVAFDACACMLFSVLANCGTVVPAQPEDVFHRASSCTVMAATPSLLNNLPTPTSDNSICSNIHTVILGGETATSDLLGPWIDAGVRVLTAYGATETTSMGCIHKVERDPQTGDIDPFLIGGLMEQSPIYLLNSDLTIIKEDFVEGEMFIGGNGVAVGYYKDEPKTNSNFIYWNGFRVYRTGDYGRWARGPAGDRVIEFRGRKDRTVKNRGFLVNLDRDVEDGLYRAGATLGIKSVHAVATDNGIIAVITPSGINTTALLTEAKHSMCLYCIPYRVEAVEDFPLSSNGKVQPRSVLDIIAAIDGSKDHQHTMSTTTSTSLETQTADDVTEDEKLPRVLRAATEVLSGSDKKLKRIDSEDSFLGMGGSSLLAFKFVFVLRQLNLHISVRDLFKCQTFSEIAQNASLGVSSEHANPWIMKDNTIAQGLADLRKQAHSNLGLADQDFDVGPLTSLQLELAMPTLADNSKCVNQVKLAYSAKHSRAVERAWRTVWQAEQVFRTEISLAIACGAQIVHKKPFRQPKLSIYSSHAEYESAVKEASLSVGLGCRLEFFSYRQTVPTAISNSGTSIPKDIDEFTVVLTVHHSLMDGCSLKLLLDNVELAGQGRSLISGASPIDANLGLIAMQRLRDAEARDFFTGYLRDVPLENGATERHSIGAKRKLEGMGHCMKTAFVEPSVRIEDVTAFATQASVSAACIYYTAWAMAISAFENSACVVVGAVFSNRATQPGHENTIGPYMSTLPLRFKFEADESVAIRLQRTMDDLTILGEYAWVRSDQVNLGHRLGNLLAMQLPLPDEHSSPPPIRVESLENSDFPLSMLVETNGSLRVLYDNTQFEDHAIRRVGEHFKHALHSLLHEEQVEDCMRLNQLQETLLREAVQVRSVHGDQTVKRALEQSVDRFFGQTALEDHHGAKLTYRELDRLTNVISHYINTRLSDAGPIALYGDGTTGWILGLLGILKTGRAYVPLDPQWPMDRRGAVYDKSAAVALLLPSAEQECEAPPISGMEVLAVDSILRDDDNKDDLPRLPDIASPDSDLVIVFTSGTTGAPKGVPISNRGFLALQSNPEATMFASPSRRIVQFMSPAFDYCNVEIFSALLHGATLVLRDPLDPYASLRKVNTATITPSVLAVLDLDDFPNLELLFATGEPVTNALVNKFASRTLFYNAYGPAECSICTSFTRIIPGDDITIGTAINTARMYILNDEQRQAPDGVRGEIYLAGIQVLRGYINAAEQTAYRVLSDPWCEGERMYRTGDYGLRGKDGRITYMGRIDRQVKIRGFRVELAGLEQAIMSGPVEEGISQCAALAVNGTLVAFVAFNTSHSDLDPEKVIFSLNSRLSKTLLPSWVPQIIVPLEQFPITANGKIDNRALETMYASKMSSRESILQNSTAHSIEGKVAEEWRRVLQLKSDTQLQDSDDFFRLGGHSVLIMLLATRLSTAFGVNVTVRELLPSPSLRGQVDIIHHLMQARVGVNGLAEAEKPQNNRSGPDRNALSTDELTELEQQVWFQYQIATSVTTFNIANILYLSGLVDIGKLLRSLNTALASDPVLCSNIVERPDGPKRTLRSSAPKVREVAQVDINAEVNYEFDPVHDELIRVHLTRNMDAESHSEHSVAQLVIVTSHIIADLGTVQNLLQITSMAYSGIPVTAHRRPRHLDSSRWIQHPSLEEEVFWKNYLSGHSYDHHKLPLLPLSLSSPSLATFEGASRTREFSGHLVTTLNKLIRRLGITHHQMGLAAAALMLQWLSGEDDIVLGAPNANRPSPVEREALGQFLDRLPVRVKITRHAIEDSMMLNTVLTKVRHSSLMALANAIPFSNILKALQFPSGPLHHPLFECMVTFHPRSAGLDNWLQLSGCDVSVSSQFAHGSKFPLMLEWFELDSDRWSLHIEYDTNHLPSATIDAIESALEVILNAMGDECTVFELQTRLPNPNLLDLGSCSDSPIASSRSYTSWPKDSSPSVSVGELVTLIQGEMTACLDKSGLVSPNTSFFSVGADSTAVVALRYRMRKLGLDIPVRAIFAAQTPFHLAEYVLLNTDNGYLSDSTNFYRG